MFLDHNYAISTYFNSSFNLPHFSLIYWFVVVQLVLRAGACTLYFAGWYLYPSPTKEEQAQYEGNGYRVEEKQIDQLK